MTVASQETGVGLLCKIQNVLECVGGGLLAPWVMRPLLGGVREEEGGEGVAKKVFTECASNRIEREEERRGGRRGEGEGEEGGKREKKRGE